MFNRDYILKGIFCTIALALTASTNSFACSTAQWDDSSGGLAGSPELVSRYSELCAFEITDGSYVASTKAADSRYIARFYVLDGLSGSGNVEIFEAYSDDAANSPLFKIIFDGSQFIFDASATSGGGTSSPVASANGWNLVEIDWQSDGSFKYWVNSDADVDPETGSVNAGTGTVQSVRLGAPNGFGGQSGKLTYDAFESHRTTPVGALLACDAEGDATNNDVDINDALAALDEVFANPSILAKGQPDCDLNGSVNINDALAILDLVF